MVGCNNFRGGRVPALLVHENALIKPLEQAVPLQPILPQRPRQLTLALQMVSQAAIHDGPTTCFGLTSHLEVKVLQSLVHLRA